MNSVKPAVSSNWKWLSFVPYVLLLVGAFRTFGHSVDDSYITFRYAANLLHGHGPVFNIGERVEGYSSPLHMLLSTVLLLASPVVDILFVSKLSSLLFGLLTLWQTKRLGRLCGLPSGFVLFAQVLVALNINFAIASVNALETSLYAFLLIMSVNTFLTEMQGQSGQKAGGKAGIASGLWLFLTLLARPDTLLVFVGLLLVRFMRAKKAGRGQAGTLSWAAAFVVPTILFIACRYAYYGYPLPNTYYAKNVTIKYALKFGIPYLQYPLVPFNRLNDHWKMVKGVFGGDSTLTGQLTVLTMPIFWGLALLGVGRATRKGRVSGQVCVAVIVAESLFILRSGGDWMSGWRFMAPSLPIFAVLQCYGLLTVMKWFRRRARQRAKDELEDAQAEGNATPAALPAPSSNYKLVVPGAVLAIWAIAAIFAPCVSWAASGFATQGEALMRSDKEQNGAFEVMVGNYIRDNLKACQSVAYSEMGYASFVNQDKKFVDVHGLTEVKLAQTAAKWKQRIGFVDRDWNVPGGPLYKYLNMKRPDAILIVSRTNIPVPTEPALKTWQPVTVIGPVPEKDRVAGPTAPVVHVYLEQHVAGTVAANRSAMTQ